MLDAGAIETIFHLPAKIFVVNLMLASMAKSTMSAFVKLPKDSYL
jgi:hypothetical protein